MLRLLFWAFALGLPMALKGQAQKPGTVLSRYSNRASTGARGPASRRCRRFCNETISTLPCSQFVAQETRFLSEHPGDYQRITCDEFDTGTKPLITIVMYSTALGSSRWERFSYLNRVAYARMHGYRFCVANPTFDPSRKPSWNKLPFVLSLMEMAKGDWIYLMDSDMAILDLSRPIERIFDLEGMAPGTDLILTTDYDFRQTDTKDLYHVEFKPSRASTAARRHPWEGMKEVSINAGSFLVRSTPWSRNFFQYVYNSFPNTIKHPWWEQRAIRDCLLRNCEGAAEHVRVVHHVLFNHYRPNANGTELAVHYAGVMWGNEFPLKMDKIYADFAQTLAPRTRHARLQRQLAIMAEGFNSFSLAAGLCVFDPEGPLSFSLALLDRQEVGGKPMAISRAEMPFMDTRGARVMRKKWSICRSLITPLQQGLSGGAGALAGARRSLLFGFPFVARGGERDAGGAGHVGHSGAALVSESAAQGQTSEGGAVRSDPRQATRPRGAAPWERPGTGGPGSLRRSAQGIGGVGWESLPAYQQRARSDPRIDPRLAGRLGRVGPGIDPRGRALEAAAAALARIDEHGGDIGGLAADYKRAMEVAHVGTGEGLVMPGLREGPPRGVLRQGPQPALLRGPPDRRMDRGGTQPVQGGLRTPSTMSLMASELSLVEDLDGEGRPNGGQVVQVCEPRARTRVGTGDWDVM